MDKKLSFVKTKLKNRRDRVLGSLKHKSFVIVLLILNVVLGSLKHKSFMIVLLVLNVVGACSSLRVSNEKLSLFCTHAFVWFMTV